MHLKNISNSDSMNHKFQQNNTYLTSFATLMDVERDTFCPFTRMMQSLTLSPASSAGDVPSTRPTRTGQESTTEKP